MRRVRSALCDAAAGRMTSRAALDAAAPGGTHMVHAYGIMHVGAHVGRQLYRSSFNNGQIQ
jgi:hypothetical protein